MPLPELPIVSIRESFVTSHEILTVMEVDVKDDYTSIVVLDVC